MPGGDITAFQMVLVNHVPPTASEDVDAVAAALFRDVGLIAGGLEVPATPRRRRRGRPRRGASGLQATADPPRPGKEVLRSTPYRMMMDCFLRHPDRGFTVEALGECLDASRPTIYRHLLRLRELDLVSFGDEGPEGGRRRVYSLRHGSPSMAWRFVELNAECALQALRQRVDLVWRSSQDRRGTGKAGPKLVLDRTSSRVSFRLPLGEMGTVDPSLGPDQQLTGLLLAVGYLNAWTGQGGDPREQGGLAYRLFKDCLLDRPERSWTIRELTAVLHTSKPTLYRHLKKLESLDLLERGLRGESPRSSKAFRIRYGDLSKAWNFTEEHAKRSLQAYRETVEHLEGLLEEVR